MDLVAALLAVLTLRSVMRSRRLEVSVREMEGRLGARLAATRARAAIAGELNRPQPLDAALNEVCAQLRSATNATTAFILVAGSEMSDSF